MKKEKKNIMGIITKLLFSISLIIFIFFIFNLNSVLPFKYIIIIIIVFLLFYIFYGLLCFKWKDKNKTIITFNILSIIFLIIELFFIFKLNDTFKFLNSNFGSKSNTLEYNVIVNKQSNYNSISDLSNSEVLYYKDLDDDSMLMQKAKDLNIVKYDNNVYDLLASVINDNSVALVSSAYYDSMIDIDEDYANKTKIIFSFEITIEVDEETINLDVTKTPFLLFINGIDTRSGKLPARSLSDVNILMAVNPKKKEILMVAIPRDYYVTLHGTTGLKDKLTHSGTFGGVNETMATIEDLFGVDINYYIRLNFNSVVNLVDTIGGITVKSDVNYSFNCHTNINCTINPGNNNLDGNCALAFARERYAYSTGDRHRGENQEQVINAILNKVTSSSTIINNYSNILKAMEGTFESNLTTDDITSLIKMQIGDMAKWNVNTYNVNGTSGMDYTYSYPHQKLSIMYPDYTTVTAAKNKIKQLLN